MPARIRRACAHLDCQDPHAPWVIRFIRVFTPDYILLCGAPVLRSSVYGVATRGALNRHPGLLLAYRGSDCPLWTLALGRPGDVAFSVVSDRVNAGELILRKHVCREAEPTLDAYLPKLQRLASE